MYLGSCSDEFNKCVCMFKQPRRGGGQNNLSGMFVSIIYF